MEKIKIVKMAKKSQIALDKDQKVGKKLFFSDQRSGFFLTF